MGHEAGWHLADVTLAASGLSGTEARVPLAGARTPECRGIAMGGFEIPEGVTEGRVNIRMEGKRDKNINTKTQGSAGKAVWCKGHFCPGQKNV